MVIGDTVHDITCGRSIDAFVVAVPTGNTPTDVLEAAQPDLLLPDLSDPRPLLEIIQQAISR
jgi:phosphoglycolate phosphatase